MNIDCTSIDWAATGSMIGAIGTILAFVGTSLLSWLIYCQTQKQQKKVDALETNMRNRELALEERQANLKEYELKIALFDERRKVYNTYLDLDRLIWNVLNKSRKAERESDSDYVSKMFRAELSAIGVINNDPDSKDLSFYCRFTFPLESSRYCYPKEVWNAILSMCTLVGLIAFGDSSGLLQEGRLQALHSARVEREQNNFWEKMNSCLTISMEDLSQ